MHCARRSGTTGFLIGLAILTVVFRAAAIGLPPGQTLADAAFGDNAFVSVGTRGTIVSSINGGLWEPRASGTTNDLQAVAHGNGIFVAATVNGTLLSSTNGIDWVVRSMGGAWSNPDIAYGNGLFVVGSKGAAAVWTMLVSSNGVDWTAINVDAVGPQNSAIPFGSIAFGEGKFLAVGGARGAGLVVTSTNGSIWREQGASIPRPSSAITGPITYGNGKFAMVVNNVTDDDDDGGSFDHVLLSDDGVSWQGSSFGAVDVRALLAADCTFVAAAAYLAPNNIAFTRGSFWWTNISLPIAMSINALAHGNGKFIAFGSEIVEFNVPASSEFIANPPVQEVASGAYAYFWTDPPICPEAAVRFQWRHNDIPIPGQTNQWLQLFGVTTNNAGAYTVLAINNAGLSVTSSVAMLIVTNYPDPEPFPPQLGPPATNAIVIAVGSETNLSFGVDGWPFPTFQWRRNNADIPGATNHYLNFYNVDARAAGGYTLVARNPLGVVTSAVVTVVVATPHLSFPTTELVQNIYEGDEARFFWPANFGGTADANYFVFRNDTNTWLPLFQANLILPEVSLADAGRYVIMASNSVSVRTGLVANLSVVPAGQLDRWARRNPLPHNDSLFESAYGNGRFVAVGERGVVVVSTNGADWALHRVKGQPTITSIASGNGVFVGVAHSVILSSTDGETWTARINRGPSWLEFATVQFGNGRFVAAGGTRVFTSTDGVDWSPATFPTHQQPLLGSIAFGNGKFVAISEFYDGARVWTSVDGITWSPTPRILGQAIGDLAFGNGLFIAVGDEGAVYTSPDGLNWISRDSDVSNRLIDVTYGNGRFVAVGTRGCIISSANGSTWRRETSGTPDRIEGVTFAGGMFIAVGENGTILSSLDGVAWAKRNHGVTRDLDGIAVGNGTLAVVGKGGSIMTSTDGSNFIQRTGATANDLHGIGWADNLFVAVGEPETIVTSHDAVQWTLRRTAVAGSSLKAVAKGNGLWVAVGTAGTVLTSPDAVTWIRRESYTLNDLNSVAYGNGTFVVVGDNLPPNGTMITSPDGITWTRRNQYTGKNLRAVTFANGTFVAIGNDGSILASGDGLAWARPSPFFFFSDYSFNLRAITYAAGVWLLVGNEGLVMTSPNLVDWLVRSRQGIDNLHGVVELDGKFVAIGNRGTILQSRTYSPVGPSLRGRFLGQGVELTVTGEPGTSVYFQHSPSLTGAPWTTFQNYFFRPDSSTIVLFDPAPTNSNARFYRAVPK